MSVFEIICSYPKHVGHLFDMLDVFTVKDGKAFATLAIDGDSDKPSALSVILCELLKWGVLSDIEISGCSENDKVGVVLQYLSFQSNNCFPVTWYSENSCVGSGFLFKEYNRSELFQNKKIISETGGWDNPKALVGFALWLKRLSEEGRASFPESKTQATSVIAKEYPEMLLLKDQYGSNWIQWLLNNDSERSRQEEWVRLSKKFDNCILDFDIPNELGNHFLLSAAFHSKSLEDLEFFIDWAKRKKINLMLRNKKRINFIEMARFNRKLSMNYEAWKIKMESSLLGEKFEHTTGGRRAL